MERYKTEEVTYIMDNFRPGFKIIDKNIKVEDPEYEDGAIAYAYGNEEDAQSFINILNYKDEIIETIARNMIAWETSKDKKEGLLPEVAVFSNPYLYEKLTGEKFDFYKVCRKYHIKY